MLPCHGEIKLIITNLQAAPQSFVTCILAVN